MSSDRREFLKFMGRASLGLSLAPLLTPLGCATTPRRPLIKDAPFPPLSPTDKDDVVLAPGFNYEILIRQGEPINGKEQFGSHNDFLAYTPFKGLANEGVMWVNHEYIHPVLIHNRRMDTPRTKEEVIKEQLSVGGSLIHIKNENGHWKYVPNSKFNRRISSRTPIPFQKGYKIFGATQAIGTLANCAGGTTPWGTVLSCEENYDQFYGDAIYANKQRTFDEKSKFRWHEYFPLPPEHYGWVIEVDPFTGKAVKRCALGRFEHEGATVKVGKSKKPVVYMGEDRRGGCIYKFISDKPGSLEKGTLFVADTVNGRWIALDIKQSKALQEHFKNQLDVLTYAREASIIAGGTPQDRPEDIEVDPNTNNIFVSLSNNSENGNYFGSLLKITEKDSDFEAMEFKSETFLSGGPESGVASPDNMAFDKKGNLWMTTDIPEYDRGPYKGFGNNALFYIPLQGPHAGKALQVASSPIDAEFTGPMFSQDCKTLFLCVQHPGSMTADPKHPTSRWPDKKGNLPRSAVITISGPALENLMK